MPKYIAKRMIWLLILLIGAALCWQTLTAIGSLITYFNEGADPGSALNIVPNVPPDLYVGLQWRPDDHDTGRQMEPSTREGIQSAYLRAWLQWNLSLIKGAPYGLETYFVGPALADLTTNVRQIGAHDWQVQQADTEHTLQLHLYSADGSIVSFTDLAATVVQIVRDKNGQMVYAGQSTAVYDVVMYLEDGNWRVRHWVRVSDDAMKSTAQHLKTPRGFIGVSGTRLMLDGRPYVIDGMNYYPKSTPWDKFWLSYNTTVIDHDFHVMDGLGINAIRIFIPFDQFGGAHIEGKNGLPHISGTNNATVDAPTVNKTIVQQPLEKLDDLLQRARRHNLHVIVTLFDFHSDYTLLQWAGTDRQLEALLTRFQNEPTILAWDLKNEPDQDYHAAGAEQVNAWLTHIARLARVYDAHHLLTIGWATAPAAQTHIVGIDFVSYHYYAPVNQLAKAYGALRAAVPDQPLVMGEYGLPTWNPVFFPGGHSEADQAAYYAGVLKFLRKSDSAGTIAWTLYDFRYIPPSVAGKWFWQTGPQGAMGVLRSDGSAKPAAHLLANGAKLDIPPVKGGATVVKPFWLAAGLLVAAFACVVLFIMRRRVAVVSGRLLYPWVTAMNRGRREPGPYRAMKIDRAVVVIFACVILFFTTRWRVARGFRRRGRKDRWRRRSRGKRR